MSDKEPMRPQLWTERPVEETIAVYRDWAKTYDADVAGRGYRTPGRMAAMLKLHLPEGHGPILDFGCGTGISGAALAAAGIGPLHGTDITDEMVEVARTKGLYEKLWVGDPGAQPAQPGDYDVIFAAGVVSLGAAPPETLDNLIDALAPGGLLILSFNDPTLENGSYDAQLQKHLDQGAVSLIAREHGPHLDDMDMGSDVILLRRE